MLRTFCQTTDATTLAEVFDNADIFLGLSAAGALKPEMLSRMAHKPLILALANPVPEIMPEVARELRPDAMVCTGRSDYANQVNNVLCFPFIFRGALDVGATTINEEMKLAAVKAIAPQCELVLVIGAPNSSNSVRLVEVAERCGTPARLIGRAGEIQPEWLEGVCTIGVTAGASAPEVLVREVIERLGEWRTVEERTHVVAEERMIFKLPRQLTE